MIMYMYTYIQHLHAINLMALAHHVPNIYMYVYIYILYTHIYIYYIQICILTRMCTQIYIYAYMQMNIHTVSLMASEARLPLCSYYVVATVSRIDKIICLFRKRAL